MRAALDARVVAEQLGREERARGRACRRRAGRAGDTRARGPSASAAESSRFASCCSAIRLEVAHARLEARLDRAPRPRRRSRRRRAAPPSLAGGRDDAPAVALRELEIDLARRVARARCPTRGCRPRASCTRARPCARRARARARPARRGARRGPAAAARTRRTRPGAATRAARSRCLALELRALVREIRRDVAVADDEVVARPSAATSSGRAWKRSHA